MTDIKTVIDEIRTLVGSKGYIYALCMILCEDFTVIPEELQDINELERLNKNEASLLLGFLIQDRIDFSVPDTSEHLIEMKQKNIRINE